MRMFGNRVGEYIFQDKKNHIEANNTVTQNILGIHMPTCLLGS